MRSSVIKELLLYRYRYILGYFILIALSIGLAFWQISSIPLGLSKLEIESAAVSSQLWIDSVSFINLPYHLLQKGTLELLGPTALGFKLPSLISALLIAAATYFLLRRWFSENIAIIGSVLTITSAHFLVLGRSGNPMILYSLWPTLLLLSASMANLQGENWRLWVWIFAIVAALSLYTPYLGFLLVIILLAVIASRQGRGLISEIEGPVASLSIMTFLALLVPLGYSIYQAPEQALAYAGIISAPEVALAVDRLKEMVQTLVDFRASDSQLFSPVLSLPALLFALYGAYYALRHASRTRYVIVTLWLFTTVALFLSTSNVSIAILFVPISLLVTIGIWRFISTWYEMFPRNPYARVAALVPIALLLFVMVQFNYNRYFYGIARSENVRQIYDSDIFTLTSYIEAQQPILTTTAIVVAPEQQAFYALLGKHYPRLVVTTAEKLSKVTGNRVLVKESERAKLSSAQLSALAKRETEVIVDDRPDDDALRFRAYK